MIQKSVTIALLSMVDHERHPNALILIDQEGYYVGDWRNFDVEGVHQVIMLLNACLRWYENNLHIGLISLFGKEKVLRGDLPKFLRWALGTRIRDCAPAKKDFHREARGACRGVSDEGARGAKWTCKHL